MRRARIESAVVCELENALYAFIAGAIFSVIKAYHCNQPMLDYNGFVACQGPSAKVIVEPNSSAISS